MEQKLKDEATVRELKPQEYARLLVETGLALPEPGGSGDRENGFWNPVPFDELARRQGISPIGDFKSWLASMPTIPDEEAGDFYRILERNKREARELERGKARPR